MVRVLPLLLLLAACGYGVTGGTEEVGHATATLTGVADRSEPGTVTHWFEYGTTTAYGSTTPAVTVEIAAPLPVEARVEGLQAGTLYHYRLCVVDDEGHGVCGQDLTFATGQPDLVSGNALYQAPGSFAPIGIVVDARSDADGTDVSGTASLYLPDPIGLRAGSVTCLSVVGNRATIGFDATADAHEDAVLTVEHGPPGGVSRFAITIVADPPTTCPEPPVGSFGWLATSGSIQVVDSP